jgi:hypothetical protein
MNVLMLSCKKATELMEKEIHFKLSILEKVQLRMHTKMCAACNAYQKNNVILEKSLHNHFLSQKKEFMSLTLSEDFKKKLIKNLEDN